MTIYERVLRPWLFKIGGGDAEAAHNLALGTLSRMSRMLGRAAPFSPPGAARTVFGIRFPNPVGLAAGMDKNGRALPAWQALGFGFVELGTVTWHRQGPNEGSRLVRLPRSEAIINRLGFPNDGAIEISGRLAELSGLRIPLGISLGRSKVVDNDKAIEDYLSSLRALYPHGDYFVVNVSSPNTPGLRELQDRAQLDQLLEAVQVEAALMAGATAVKPIVVKVAPDLTDPALAEVLEVCADRRIDGIIATNTTISRDGVDVAEAELAQHPGGLSGAPMTRRVREVVSFINQETGGALPVIGVGGVMCEDDATRLIDAGASLIQIYSGLIYRGPRLIRGCVRRLAE